MVQRVALVLRLGRQVRAQVAAPVLRVRRLARAPVLLARQVSFQLASWRAWPARRPLQEQKRRLRPEQAQVLALAQVRMQAQRALQPEPTLAWRAQQLAVALTQ
jgi:hypothetical protein